MPQKLALNAGTSRGLRRNMTVHSAKAGIGTYRTHKDEAAARPLLVSASLLSSSLPSSLLIWHGATLQLIYSSVLTRCRIY